MLYHQAPIHVLNGLALAQPQLLKIRLDVSDIVAGPVRPLKPR